MPTGIQTWTDRYVNPLDVNVFDVDIADIAYALSNLTRVAGNVYTVAQHSVLVSELAAGHKLAALLHDAPEYLLNDFAGPVKANSEFGAMYKVIEFAAAGAIEVAFGLDRGELRDPLVKEADVEMLHVEAYHLMRNPPWAMPSEWGKEMTLVPWSHDDAEARFLRRFEELHA